MKPTLAIAAVVWALPLFAQVATTIQVPANLVIPKDSALAQAALNRMGVTYLWRLNGSDTSLSGQTVSATDFMGRGHAQGDAKLVSVQECNGDAFVLFQRPSPDYPVGGSLRVNEQSPLSRLNAGDEFTIGAWVKQYPNYVEDFRNLGPSHMSGGYMPLLARYAPSTRSEPGGFEWILHLTSEIAYLNINRGWTGQNDMNAHVAGGWAHTFGSCYQSGYHRECWHYVSVAVNPRANTVQFIQVRQPGWRYGDGANDFIATGVTNAQLNGTAIPSIPHALLRIGATDTEGTQGIIRGLSFARRALSAAEVKALADFTAPTAKGFLCGGLDLRPRLAQTTPAPVPLPSPVPPPRPTSTGNSPTIGGGASCGTYVGQRCP